MLSPTKKKKQKKLAAATFAVVVSVKVCMREQTLNLSTLVKIIVSA